jgi:NADH dehydrogenase [ubiquinone] 1 alpha subcomplex assembly factor 1
MKSKGQTLAMTLEEDRRWYFPYFKHQLITASEGWQVIEIDLAEFKQYQIGRYTGNRLTTDSQAAILRMGFTTDDKKEGPFEAEIDYIEFL